MEQQLAYKEQEKVLLNIIAQKGYQQLPQMVENGYTLSMTVLETLRWSGQTDLIVRLLKKGFTYICSYMDLFNFLQVLLGEKQVARLIMEESKKDGKHPLARLLSYLPSEILAENGFWDTLKQRGEWRILAKYGHIDDLILTEIPYPSEIAEIAKVLSEYQAEKRIVELKRYELLVRMPGGSDLLWQEKQFKILFENRKSLYSWSEKKTCQKLCSCPEGQELLYQNGERGWDILLSHGCFDPFREHGEWRFLLKKGYPDAINWDQWLRNVLASGSELEIGHFYEDAGKAGQWHILVENGQSRLLLRMGKYHLFIKSLLHSSPKVKERRQNSNGSSCICNDKV